MPLSEKEVSFGIWRSRSVTAPLLPAARRSPVGHGVAIELFYDVGFDLVFLTDELFELTGTFELKHFGFFLSADFFILLDGQLVIFYGPYHELFPRF